MVPTESLGKHNIHGGKVLRHLSEAFHFQLELSFGPEQRGLTSYLAETMGQPTPRICLENSCWRIWGMKVMLGWQSISMKTQCLCNIWTPTPRTDKLPQKKHRSPDLCQLKCWHAETQLNPCSRDSPNERKSCEPTWSIWAGREKIVVSFSHL